MRTKIEEFKGNEIFIIHEKSTETDRFTLVAVRDGLNVKIGLSFCNDKDKFVKKEGIKIATERALVSRFNIPVKTSNPSRIRKMLYNLVFMINMNIDFYKQNLI